MFRVNRIWIAIVTLALSAIQCSDMGKNSGPDVNEPPRITSSANTVAVEADLFSYMALAIDPEGSIPSISYANMPSWLTLVNDSLSGTTPTGAADTSFQAIASDGELADTVLVSITITADGISYSADIQPEFDNNCAYSGCHLAPGQAAGMELDSYAHVMQGSQNGHVVIPFDADNSLIVHRIEGTTPPSMPLNGTPLPDFTIQRIRNWISQGARNN